MPYIEMMHKDLGASMGRTVLKLISIIITVSLGLCATAHCSEYDRQSDFEDSLELKYAGSTAWSHFSDMIVDGHLLYAAMVFGVKILDLSNPEKPSLVSQVYMNGSLTYSLALQKPYLYGRTVDGLSVFDVTEPAAPELLGRLDHSCDEGGMAVAGDYAYLSCGTRLVTVDISIPTYPVITSDMILPRNGGDARFYVADTLMYLAAQRFFVVSIADPAHPEVVSTIGWPDIDCAKDLAVVDSLVFIANHPCGEPPGRSKFNIVNVANPLLPEIIATHEIGAGVYHMARSSQNVFVSCGMTGIVSFDVTDPTSPVIAGCYMGPGIAGPIVMCGDHLIVSDDMPAWTQSPGRICDPDSTSKADSLTRPGDLQIVNVSDPPSLTLIGRVPTGALHRYLAVSDSHVYVSELSGDIVVVDNSNSDTVTRKRSIELPQLAGKQCVSGDYLYVPLGPRGLHIMDVSNLDSVVTVGEVVTQSSAGAVDVQGNYAYVTESQYGLEIVEITDPNAPHVVGSIFLEGGLIMDVAVHGSHAYVAASDRMLVVDVANAASPSVIGVFMGSYILNLAVQDTLVYAGGGARLHAISVSDPMNPVGVSEWNGAEIRDVATNGDYLYTASAEAGALIFDVSDPGQIVLASQIHTPLFAVAVCATHEYVWVGDTYGILRYVSPGSNNGLDLPTTFTLHQNFPNPFNHSTTISFYLTGSAHTTLEVLNILGQRVETLLDRTVPSGTVTAGWDASGHASGVYLYRLTVGDSQQTKKMLLLK
ncbi:MAG: T9SS type A sorting domain-containing protein [candidate division Zixibacteria bacterium]|nr:T9SS type A sorting domain-containing protein [candidate division Zixibacteria bacterium]